MKALSPVPSHSPLSAAAAVVLALSAAQAGDWPQWRGPSRDGISPETGLLKEWPAGGPKLLWQAKEVGMGYSTPSVRAGHLYLLSNEGVNDEYVQAHATADGKRTWRTRLGKVGNPDQQPKFPAARSTPTLDGDALYALGSDGDLACVEAASGKIRWQKNLRSDFGGKPGTWAYSESPLVDGEALVCAPGGGEATMLALNKKSGEVLWKTALPDGDEAAYSSTILVDAGGIRQYVQMFQRGLAGFDARTGKLLWRYPKTVSQYRANIPTPVARGGLVYSAGAGTGGGLVKVSAANGGLQAEQVYFSPKLPTAIGGGVLVGEYLYGTGNQGLMCVEFATGAIKWADSGIGAASLCFADGRLYLHGENGEVALVEPSAEAYREKGRFAPPQRPKRSQQMEKVWTYPVVAGGRLYLRDHNLLWCYDIQAR